MNRFLARHAVFLAVFPLLGCLFFLSIREGNDWGGDFAIYVLEARNLATHRPLAENTFLVTPDSMRNHPAVYPPFASLLIAPVYALHGIDYDGFKRVLTFFLWLSLLIYYAIGCRRGIPPPLMAVLILIFGMSPIVFTLGSFVGSDGVFLFVSSAAIFAIDGFYRKGWVERRPITAAFFTATLLTLAYLTRAAGLALIVGFGVNELWQGLRVRKFGVRKFGVLSVALTACALFACMHFVYRASGQYDSQFVFGIRQWLSNDIGYLQTPAIFWAEAPALLRYALSSAALILIVAGAVRRLSKPGLIEFCVIAWLAMLTLYYINDKRYILPVVPYAEMFGAEALMAAVALVPAHRRMLPAGIGMAAVLVSVLNYRAFDRSPVPEGVTNPSFESVCRFLRTRIEPGALILSWDPRVFALYTDRPSALYPQNARPPRFEADIPWKGPRYLVVHKREDDAQRLRSYLEFAGPHLRIAFENVDFRVYFIPPPLQSALQDGNLRSARC